MATRQSGPRTSTPSPRLLGDREVSPKQIRESAFIGELRTLQTSRPHELRSPRCRSGHLHISSTLASAGHTSFHAVHHTVHHVSHHLNLAPALAVDDPKAARKLAPEPGTERRRPPARPLPERCAGAISWFRQSTKSLDTAQRHGMAIRPWADVRRRA